MTKGRGGPGLSVLPPGEDVVAFGTARLVSEPALYRDAQRRLELRADVLLPVVAVKRALRGGEALRLLGSVCIAIGSAGVVLLCTYAFHLAF